MFLTSYLELYIVKIAFLIKPMLDIEMELVWRYEFISL